MFSARASGAKRKSANAPLSQDFMMASSYLLNPNNDLAHEVAVFHVFVGGRRLVELEHTIDQGTNFVFADERIHRLEVFARPDIDAARRSIDPHDGIRGQVTAVARQPADQGNVAAISEYFQGLGQRIATADIQHLVNTVPTADSLHLEMPIRVTAIIRGPDGAHFQRALQLVIARTRDDRFSPEGVRENESENRNAAGALEQHVLAWLDAPTLEQRDPCGDRRTRQRRGFFVRKMSGD